MSHSMGFAKEPNINYTSIMTCPYFKQTVQFCTLLFIVSFQQNVFGQVLIDQDFETGTAVDYILKDESNGGTVFPADVSQAFADEDYLGRLQISDLDPADGLDFVNVQGTHFFGANDYDGIDAAWVTLFSIVGDTSNPNSTNTNPALDSNNDGTPDAPLVEIDETFMELDDTFDTGL